MSFAFFEAPDARCPKRPRSALFGLFRWLDYHVVKLYYVSLFMRGGELYEADFECQVCGARLRRHHLRETDLVRLGVPLDVIRETGWWAPKQQSAAAKAAGGEE